TGEAYGLGRIGTLEEPVAFDDFVKQVKQAYNCETVTVVSKNEKPVKKIAVLGGSGQSYINQAKKMGADVYITGDITFHQAQDAMEMDLQLIDPGHYVEEIMKMATKNYLEKHFPQQKVNESTINKKTKKIVTEDYNTDNITIHQTQDAMEMDLQLIDPGHYVEEIMKMATKNYLEKHFPQLKVNESTVNTNPFQFV